MNTTFHNSINSKTDQINVSRLTLANKVILEDNLLVLSKMTCCYSWKKTTPEYNNGSFTIAKKNRSSGAGYKHSFILSTGSYSVKYFSDYFAHILKREEQLKYMMQ